MSAYLLGIDVGTQSSKGALVTVDGRAASLRSASGILKPGPAVIGQIVHAQCRIPSIRLRDTETLIASVLLLEVDIVAEIGFGDVNGSRGWAESRGRGPWVSDPRSRWAGRPRPRADRGGSPGTDGGAMVVGAGHQVSPRAG